MNVDLRCYLVTSGSGPATINTAAEAARAGTGVIQVRGKELSTAELFALTCAVADAVNTANPQTRVVVNDRVDVALAARDAGVPVHGVHLGQDDLPVTHARAILGPQAIIGLSAGSLELVRQADTHREAIDYLGVGPFRPTPTKDTGRQPLGLASYPQIVAATQLPIVAIGGVGLDDVDELARTGIAGVALVRAIMDAEQPGDVVDEVLVRMQRR